VISPHRLVLISLALHEKSRFVRSAGVVADGSGIVMVRRRCLSVVDREERGDDAAGAGEESGFGDVLSPTSSRQPMPVRRSW
jgi:hypothetical protein